MSGTVLAQLIPLAFSPVMTRLYQPEQFAHFSILIALSGTLSVILGGRYESAIMLPKLHSHASQLFTLTILLAITISSILFFIVNLFGDTISSISHMGFFSPYLPAVPIIALGLLSLQVILNWLNRIVFYKGFVAIKIIQNAASALFQIFLSFTVLFVGGLIWGYSLGLLLALLLGIVLVSLKSKSLSFFPNIPRIIVLARRYREFPLYAAGAALLDTLTLHLPLFFINAQYPLKDVGNFGLTTRVLSAPIAVISFAIGQVFYQRISVLIYENREEARKLFLWVFKTLTVVGIILFSPLLLAGGHLFSWIFGENWLDAGIFAQIMSIAFFMRFTISPLSVIFGVLNKVKVSSVWKLLYFLSTILVCVVGSKFNLKYFLLIFMVNELILYSLYFLIMHKLLKN